MLISATLSKPAKNIEETLGKPYNKIKITAQSGAEGTTYFCEFFRMIAIPANPIKLAKIAVIAIIQFV